MFTIIGGDGKEYGPVSVGQVRGWIAGGRANLDTKAKAVGSDDWRRLGDFPEFASPDGAPPVMAGAAAEGSGGSLILAGLGSRLGAAVLDTMLLMAVTLPGNLMLGRELVRQGINPRSLQDLQSIDWTQFVPGVSAMAAGAAALALVHIVLLSLRGQTLGKLAVGIRIVRVDEAPAGFVHAVLLRAFVPAAIQFVLGMVPFLPLGIAFWLADILCIFREDRRCLHDMIAGTKVVQR